MCQPNEPFHTAVERGYQGGPDPGRTGKRRWRGSHRLGTVDGAERCGGEPGILVPVQHIPGRGTQRGDVREPKRRAGGQRGWCEGVENEGIARGLSGTGSLGDLTR